MALNSIELNAIKKMLLEYSKLIENNTAQGAYAWNYAEKVRKEIELLEADSHCEECDNGTDTPCTACLWEEGAN